VPGAVVGEGHGLVERKRGWMFVSWNGLYSQVEWVGVKVGVLKVDRVGESRWRVEAFGERWTRLSNERWVGGLRRRLGMLRMLLLPRRGRE
jgi:hypothetical protein